MTCKYSNRCTTYHHYRSYCPNNSRSCDVAKEYRKEISRILEEFDSVWERIFERGMRDRK